MHSIPANPADASSFIFRRWPALYRAVNTASACFIVGALLAHGKEGEEHLKAMDAGLAMLDRRKRRAFVADYLASHGFFRPPKTARVSLEGKISTLREMGYEPHAASYYETQRYLAVKAIKPPGKPVTEERVLAACSWLRPKDDPFQGPISFNAAWKDARRRAYASEAKPVFE